MSRFLTPGKICLLCLTTVYCNDLLEKKSAAAVLSFIVSYLQNEPTAINDGTSSRSLPPPPVTLTLLERALSAHSTRHSPSNVFEIMLHRLWYFITGVDGMFDFFGTLSLMWLSEKERMGSYQSDAWVAMRERGAEEYTTKLSKSSLLGAFLRRAQLEFMRLQFQDAVRLWQAFEDFREPSRKQYQAYLQDRGEQIPEAFHQEDFEAQELNDTSNGRIFEVLQQRSFYGASLEEGAAPPLDAPLSRSNEQGFISTDEIQKLLDFQIRKMQKFGCTLPLEIKKPLEGLIIMPRSTPSVAFYLKFLDAWNIGDYHESFEYLHRYYGYAMHSRDPSQYQFALLNTAILQADFGCYDEAVIAMKEAISTARENKDITTLNYCLIWLYHLSKSHPLTTGNVDAVTGLPESDADALDFLIYKARTAGSNQSPMYNIWSSAILAQAQSMFSQGGQLRDAIQKILQSSYLNLHFQVPNVVGSQMLLQSSVFSRIGFSTLASQHCEILASCYVGQVPEEDILRARCRIAEILVSQGRYKEAQRSVSDTILQNKQPTVKAWRLLNNTEKLLGINQCLREDKLDEAANLLALARAAPISEIETDFEVRMLNIDLLLRRRSYSEAFTKIEDAVQRCNKSGSDVAEMVKLSCAKANLFCQSGRPHKALSLTVRAVTAAWQSDIIPGLWQSLKTLSEVLVSFGEYDAADSIISAILPHTLASGNRVLTAQLWEGRAEQAVAKAKGVPADVSEQKVLVESALDSVLEAQSLYRALGDIASSAKLAAKASLLYRYLGQDSSAELYALQYEKIAVKGAEGLVDVMANSQ